MPELYSIRFDDDEALAEYKVTLAALSRFRAGIEGGQPGFSLPPGTRSHHLQQTVEELEGTDLIRMWTVFEAAWASFWRHKTGRTGSIKAQALIDWARGVHEVRHRTADQVTNDVHRVRLYRNFLVHGDHPAPPVSIVDAKTYLNRHLVELPNDWPGAEDED